jgi:hypothetical protein
MAIDTRLAMVPTVTNNGASAEGCAGPRCNHSLLFRSSASHHRWPSAAHMPAVTTDADPTAIATRNAVEGVSGRARDR